MRRGRGERMIILLQPYKMVPQHSGVILYSVYVLVCNYTQWYVITLNGIYVITTCDCNHV